MQPVPESPSVRCPRHVALRMAAWPVLLVLAVVARAAPGDIDAAWGDGGAVLSGGSVIPLPNGGIAAGRNWVYGFEVVALDGRGQPDASFGNRGRTVVTLPPTPQAYFGTSAVRMPDGGLVFAGWLPPASGSAPSDVNALLRLTSTGAVDASFGGAGDGIARLTGSGTIAGLVVQADGRLVLAWVDYIGDDNDGCQSTKYAVIRLLPDGSPDATFGLGGRVPVPDLESPECAGPALFVAGAGGSIVIGDGRRIRRLTAQGTVDASFTGPGDDAFAGVDEAFRGGVSTPDGGLLLHSATGLTKLRADGQRDTTFGGDGTLRAGEDGALGTAHEVIALAMTPDGRHVYVGAKQMLDHMGDRSCLVILRLSVAGVRDTGFGRDGATCISWGQVSFGRSFVALSGGQPLFEIWARATGSRLYRLLVDPLPSPGVISLKVNQNTAWMPDSGGSHTFTIMRSAGKDGAVSVDYSTVPGTAAAGSDFIATSGRLEWASGDDSPRTVEVRIVADNVAEGTESYSLQLSAPGGGAVLIGATQVAEITESSGQPGSTPPPAPPTPPQASPGSSSGGGGGAFGWLDVIGLLMLLAAAREATGRCPRASVRSRAPID